MSATTADLARLNDRAARDLRDLTRTLVTDGHADQHVGGIFGGEYGYGVEFTNDTFEMHPYNWDDCSCGRDEAESLWCNTNEHAPTCYQQVIRNRGFLDYDDATELDLDSRSAHNRTITDAVCAEMGLDPEIGSYVHCTCSHDTDYSNWLEAHPHDEAICAIDRPNFRHKPTGSTVTFYKYLGRGMNVDLIDMDWQAIIDECRQSLIRPV